MDRSQLTRISKTLASPGLVGILYDSLIRPRASFSIAYTSRWCIGFPCILSPRCIRFAMQKLFEPHATRLPDLVSNRGQSF
jgi:hypothetical protein